MRLGILPFGERDANETSLADSLRAMDIDIVLADVPVTSAGSARDEAQRLQRADCDGIFFVVAESARPALGAEAALHIGAPILLGGGSLPCRLETAGVLADVGIPFDRLIAPPSGEAALIASWLTENGKSERQRGVEAVRKLYGQRLCLSGRTVATTGDTALWLAQFGVIVSDAGEADCDFIAIEGDALGALTRQLLAFVADDASVADVTVSNLVEGDSANAPPATFARISRRRNRFQCVMLTGAVSVAGYTVDCNASRLEAALLSSRLHTVGGAHIGALRAACEALDIDTRILR
jgi:hypothetical protein